MNTFLLCAIVFLLCSIMNLFNLYRSGNGFSLVLGVVWLAASFVMFLRYRKSTKKDDDQENGETV